MSKSAIFSVVATLAIVFMIAILMRDKTTATMTTAEPGPMTADEVVDSAVVGWSPAPSAQGPATTHAAMRWLWPPPIASMLPVNSDGMAQPAAFADTCGAC